MRLGVYIICECSWGCEISSRGHLSSTVAPVESDWVSDHPSSCLAASINPGNTSDQTSRPILREHTNGGGRNTRMFWQR